MRLRPAVPGEAGMLSELCFRSKAHWGYDDAFMEACRDELTLRGDDVERRRCAVAERDGEVVGVYTLDGSPPEADVGLFFVAPGAIGTGVGRLLWDDMVARARESEFRRLSIEADPNAEGFYVRMGAERVGEAPSGSIPGRSLPLLRYKLR